MSKHVPPTPETLRTMGRLMVRRDCQMTEVEYRNFRMTPEEFADRMVDDLSMLIQEIERLRERNKRLQRRVQGAESAVAQMKQKWDEHGGPCGGNFGRALLAHYCGQLEEKVRRLESTSRGG